MLGKATHQQGESLDALAKPPPPKRTVIPQLLTRRATVLPPDYASHKQKELAEFIRKVETVLEFVAAVYPMERDQMLFTKQYLVSNAVAT